MSKLGRVIGKIPVGTVLSIIERIAERIRQRRELKRKKRALEDLIAEDRATDARPLDLARQAEDSRAREHYRGGSR